MPIFMVGVKQKKPVVADVAVHVDVVSVGQDVVVSVVEATATVAAVALGTVVIQKKEIHQKKDDRL